MNSQPFNTCEEARKAVQAHVKDNQIDAGKWIDASSISRGLLLVRFERAKFTISAMGEIKPYTSPVKPTFKIKRRKTETGYRFDLIEGKQPKGHWTTRQPPTGYVCIDVYLAHRMFDAKLACTMTGNNVNAWHVFGGWRLGYTWSIDAMTDQTFAELLNNWLYYLDSELGSYPVFYARKSDLKKLESEVTK